MMIDKRLQQTPDLVRHYCNLILEERQKLEEAYAAIAEYSEQLRKVATESERRLLTKD